MISVVGAFPTDAVQSLSDPRVATTGECSSRSTMKNRDIVRIKKKEIRKTQTLLIVLTDIPSSAHSNCIANLERK